VPNEVSFSAASETRFQSSLNPPASSKPTQLAKLSINAMTTYRWSLLETVDSFKRMGIDSIGIWRPKLSEFGEERGIDLIHESGLKVSSLSWSGGFTGSHGYSYLDALDDARDALHVAAELQADCLVIITGSRSGHLTNYSRRLVYDAMNSLASDAERLGVSLAIQPMHYFFAEEWTFLTTLKETFQILDECQSDSIGIAVDLYHLWQDPLLSELIENRSKRIKLVQVADWKTPVLSELDRHLPGDGIIPLEQILKRIQQSSYSGFYETNILSDELWKTNYEHLVPECHRRMQDFFPIPKQRVT